MILHTDFHVQLFHCVVPENTHPPTAEGMEMLKEWGVKDPGNSEGEGGCMVALDAVKFSIT